MVQGSSIQCWFVVGRVAMILILGDIIVINKGCHVSAIQYVYVIYRSLPEIHNKGHLLCSDGRLGQQLPNLEHLLSSQRQGTPFVFGWKTWAPAA